MGKLDGKVALITGATSGIGEGCARLFASEGADVIVVGRSEEKGGSVVSAIREKGGIARFLYCDVTQQKSVLDLKENYCKDYDHLDILVNNAGILLTSPIGEIEEADWKRVFDTNTHSVMYMTQAFIELVIKCHGNILNNTSIEGLQSRVRGRSTYAYAASKTATVKFTQQCALNYTGKGIRVNCLCPGTTETPIFTNRDFSRFIDGIPMGRVGQVEEIAKAALFLVSDDASYVSGAVLTVDGGAALM